MFKYLKVISKLSLIGLCISSYAQESPKGIYLGASLGYSKFEDQTGKVNSELIGAAGGTAQSSQDSGAAAYRLFGGLSLNEYIAIELGYTQTANQTLTFSGVTSLSTNYTGSFTASYTGADLGLVLHPIQLPIFKFAFIDLGMTRFTEKQLGSVSTSLGSYNQSRNELGTGHYYGLGYDIPVQTNTYIRLAVNHYDSIGGDSAIKSNLASVGLLTKF